MRHLTKCVGSDMLRALRTQQLVMPCPSFKRKCVTVERLQKQQSGVHDYRRDSMPFDLISGKFIPEKSNIWRDCVDGHYDWVKEHVMEGAPLNESDHCGDPPLLLAAGNGHLACVKLLLEEGADIEQRNVMKEPPLSRAAHNGHLQMVQYLVQQGADVNCLDLGENTPLHWAAMRGHVEIVRYLVEQHADRSLRNRQDKIAIDLCQPCWSNSYAYTRAVLAA